MIRVIDLFFGAGGLSLGLAMVGRRTPHARLPLGLGAARDSSARHPLDSGIGPAFTTVWASDVRRNADGTGGPGSADTAEPGGG